MKDGAGKREEGRGVASGVAGKRGRRQGKLEEQTASQLAGRAVFFEQSRRPGPPGRLGEGLLAEKGAP